MRASGQNPNSHGSAWNINSFWEHSFPSGTSTVSSLVHAMALMRILWIKLREVYSFDFIHPKSTCPDRFCPSSCADLGTRKGVQEHSQKQEHSNEPQMCRICTNLLFSTDRQLQWSGASCAQCIDDMMKIMSVDLCPDFSAVCETVSMDSAVSLLEQRLVAAVHLITRERVDTCWNLSLSARCSGALLQLWRPNTELFSQPVDAPGTSGMVPCFYKLADEYSESGSPSIDLPWCTSHRRRRW